MCAIIYQRNLNSQFYLMRPLMEVLVHKEMLGREPLMVTVWFTSGAGAAKNIDSDQIEFTILI